MKNNNYTIKNPSNKHEGIFLLLTDATTKIH